MACGNRWTLQAPRDFHAFASGHCLVLRASLLNDVLSVDAILRRNTTRIGILLDENEALISGWFDGRNKSKNDNANLNVRAEHMFWV